MMQERGPAPEVMIRRCVDPPRLGPRITQGGVEMRMNRQHFTEQSARIRREECRDPAENALSAFAALTDEQRQAVVDRFNKTFNRCVPAKKLVYVVGAEA